MWTKASSRKGEPLRSCTKCSWASSKHLRERWALVPEDSVLAATGNSLIHHRRLEVINPLWWASWGDIRLQVPWQAPGSQRSRETPAEVPDTCTKCLEWFWTWYSHRGRACPKWSIATFILRGQNKNVFLGHQSWGRWGGRLGSYSFCTSFEVNCDFHFCFTSNFPGHTSHAHAGQLSRTCSAAHARTLHDARPQVGCAWACLHPHMPWTKLKQALKHLFYLLCGRF